MTAKRAHARAPRRAPESLPEWQEPSFYPSGYNRDRLKVDAPELRQNQFLKWEGTGYEGKEEQNDPWRQLAGIPLHAEILHRFSDRRQIPFKGKPLPDGSNIGITITAEDGTQRINGSPALRSTYGFYRRWLEYLYLRSVLSVNLTSGPDGPMDVNDDLIEKTLAVDLFREVADIAAEEQSQVPELAEFRQYDSIDGLRWIATWRKGIACILHDMLAASSWATTWNKDERRAMEQAYREFGGISRILVSLLYKEELFERRLQAFHVEDEHAFKRIRLVATENIILAGKTNVEQLTTTYFTRVLRRTRAMQSSLRKLFSFRQLRDWGYGRPWLQMHLVFDTTIQLDLAPHIQRARELMESTPRTAELFGVIPVELSAIGESDRCTICLEDWEDHDLVMEHNFHAACLIRYWDQERRFNFLCPLCRIEGGRVRDRVEFNPEMEDFVPNVSEAAAHDMTVLEVLRLINETPNLNPAELPEDYRAAIGREMEKGLLERAFTMEDEGRRILPIP